MSVYRARAAPLALLVLFLCLAACTPSGTTAPAETPPAPPTPPPAVAPTYTPTPPLPPAGTPIPREECPPNAAAISAELGIPTQVILNYPPVDSSTSASPLQRLIACRILGIPCVEYSNLFSVDLFMPHSAFLDCPSSREIFDFAVSGTHGSYVSLVEGDASFILVARAPSDEEIVLAEENGVEFDVQPVALDAFVFLVNSDNPIASLDLEMIRSIYTGEVTDWGTALGSEEEGSKIHPYRRDDQSGSQQLMERLVMRGVPMADFPEALFPGAEATLFSMSAPIHTIAVDPQGLAYSVYYYATNMDPSESIRLIGIDGVRPTAETISDGSYPLVTEVYAVVRADEPADSSAVLLRDWLLTPRGQEVVTESGYVPINP